MTDEERVAAVTLVNQSRFVEAENLCKEILARQPADPDAHFVLAQALLATYHLDDARAHCESALASSSDARVQLLHGEILFALKLLDPAAEVFRSVLQRDSGNRQAIFGLGKVDGFAKANVGVRLAQPDTASLLTERSGNSNENLIYSAKNEQLIIARLVALLAPASRYVVDIGAADGLEFSNSYALIASGWSAVCIEPRHEQAAQLTRLHRNALGRVNVCCAFAFPQTVNDLLAGLGVPGSPGVMSVDIDSYEYDLLGQILKSYRPEVLCVEINERVPPPIRYALLYDETIALPNMAIYGGCSISMMSDLLRQRGYAVVALEYNNLFAVPVERLPKLAAEFPALSAEQAYQAGYLEKPDRLSYLPWNARFDFLRDLGPKQAVLEFEKMLSGIKCRYFIHHEDHVPDPSRFELDSR